MSQKDFLVSKLMAGGGEMPVRTRWWVRHSKDLSRFLLLSGSSDARSSISTRQLLLSEALEWDEIVCGARREGPMSDHTKLEIELVSAAIKMDLVKLNKIGDNLRKNVHDLVDASVLRASEVPKDRLRGLLTLHVGLFVESIMQYMDGKEEKYVACEGRRNGNTLELAAFTTEWI